MKTKIFLSAVLVALILSACNGIQEIKRDGHVYYLSKKIDGQTKYMVVPWTYFEGIIPEDSEFKFEKIDYNQELMSNIGYIDGQKHILHRDNEDVLQGASFETYEPTPNGSGVIFRGQQGAFYAINGKTEGPWKFIGGPYEDIKDYNEICVYKKNGKWGDIFSSSLPAKYDAIIRVRMNYGTFYPSDYFYLVKEGAKEWFAVTKEGNKRQISNRLIKKILSITPNKDNRFTHSRIPWERVGDENFGVVIYWKEHDSNYGPNNPAYKRF